MAFSINLSKRGVTGKGVRALRAKGFIPAVIYGHKFPSQNVMAPYNQFLGLFKKAGESSLVDATVEDKGEYKVLIHGVSKNSVDGRIEHVDFYVVDMKEKIRTEAPLRIVGEARAVKELGGILVHNFDSIEIECLPEDLISEIEVDISALNEIGDTIHVKDLNFGGKKEKIKIFLHPDDPVISIAPPRSEEELKALDEKVEEKVQEIEVVKKTKETLEDESKDSDTA